MRILVVAALLTACQGNKSAPGTFTFEQKFKTDSTRMVGPPHEKTASLADAMPRLEVKGAATAIVDALRTELEGNALVKRGNVAVELASPLTVELPSGSTIVELNVHAVFIDAPNVIVIDAKVAGPLKYTGADAKLFGRHLADEVTRVFVKEKVPANAGPPAGKPPKAIGIGSGQPSCTVHEDKSVRCWHRGDAPMLVPKAAGTIAVDGGQNFGACGLRENGTVYCMAVGTSANLDAVDVCGVAGAKAISVGDDAGCALLGDGTVKCWPDETDAFAPCGAKQAFTIEGVTGATAIHAGPFRGVALLGDGSVKSWELRDMKAAPKASVVKGVAKATAVVSGFAECGVVGAALVCNERGKTRTWKLPETAVEVVHAKTTCVRTTSGKIYCVNGDKVEPANLSGVVDIDGDLAGLCGITVNGDVGCTDAMDGKDTDPPVPVRFAL